MTVEMRWRSMATAPKDGRRILVTVDASEQGPAFVDEAFWAPADAHEPEGWRSAESGMNVGYADTEVRSWLPVAERAQRPAPWLGPDEELDGSGI